MAVDPTGAVGAITDLANEANAQIDALSGELVQAQHDLSAADQQIAARDELNAALEAQVVALQQQLADCQSGQEPDPLPDPEPSPDPDPLDDGGTGTTPGPEYAMTIAGMIDLGSKKTASNTWDQAFDAAIADAKAKKAATGVAPAIMFPAGERVALSGTRTAYDGMCLIGPGIGSIQRSANSIQTDVRYSGAGPMFVLAATTFDVTIVGLSIQGNNAGIFFDTKGFVLWESTFRDMGMNGWKHIWGTPASKFLNTLCTWDGRHNYNNHRGQPWNLGGSDSALFFSRFASDVGGNATYKSEFAATGDGFQLSLNSQQKMAVSGLYFTAEGQASGVKVSNSSSDHLVSLDKSIIEGRNGGAPCLRDLLRVTGGRVRVTDTLLNYANKSGSTEQGAPIVVTGGYLSIEACDHNRASGVSNSKPVVFVANGAKFRGYGCTSNDGSPWVVAAQASADVQTDATFSVVRV
jgi:hypothetical protein